MRKRKRDKTVLEPFPTSWSERFASISKDGKGNPPWGYSAAQIRFLLGRDKDRISIIKAWMRTTLQSNRESRWHALMLWALQNSPERALKLLDASVTTPWLRPSRHVAGDCIEYLTAFYLDKETSPDPLKVDTLIRITCNFAEACVVRPGQVSPIPQAAVFRLLQHCDDHQAEILLETLRRQNMIIHENTLLHFLERFVGMGRISLSLEILRNLVSSGIDVASDKLQSACVQFLRLPFHVENRYNIQTSILAEILEIGIRPGTIMYTVIILNAIEAGDYQTAWQMYEMVRETSLKPNAATYSVMLKGAKQSLDSEIIDHVISDAEEDGNLPHDQRLVWHVLDALFALELSRKQRLVFTTLLRTYAHYCDVRPLQELGMVSGEFDTPPHVEREVQPPSHHTLGLMVLAYIKQYQHSDMLLPWYRRYHALVKEEHPTVAPLAETDHISNALIMAFGRRPQSLGSCILVIKHMLTPLETTENTIPIKLAVPTVRTWSVLIAAYFRQGQKRAARKVLEMMEARGMKPNEVTWNTIISGYSQLQDVDGAVDAMQQMEVAGFDVDAHTLKGLGKLRDRDRVLEALKKAIGNRFGEEQHTSVSTNDSIVEE